MLFTQLLLAVLPVLALSTKSTKEAKFSAMAKKNNGIVILDSNSYDEILEGNRNFSISILLTAMADQYKCNPCHIFDPEHALVAKQWSKQSQRDDHYFAILDFADGGTIYNRLGISNAPTFQLFRPNDGPRASPKPMETMDFSRAGFKAEALVDYIKTTTEIPLKFSRPIDKVKAILTGLGLGLFILISIFAWPLLLKMASFTHLWSAGTMFIILIMTSGYMWNQIRNPQYVQASGNGQVNYFAGGFSNQLGVETHIISAIYGVLGFAAYTLAYTIPKLQDPVRQRLGVYVWTGISIVMMGVLMNIFSMKQGGYPFRFF